MKKTINKTTEWKKIFANDISGKGLLSKILKELMQLNILKNATQLKNRQRLQIDIFPKKTYRWATGT